MGRRIAKHATEGRRGANRSGVVVAQRNVPLFRYITLRDGYTVSHFLVASFGKLVEHLYKYSPATM